MMPRTTAPAPKRRRKRSARPPSVELAAPALDVDGDAPHRPAHDPRDIERDEPPMVRDPAIDRYHED